MRKKKIKIPIYGGSLTLIQTDDFKAIENKYGLMPLDDIDAFIFRIPEKYGNYMIVFPKRTNAAIIAHECLHLVNYVFQDCHIQLDPDNDEPQCYLLEWFVGKCFDFLL